jgi:hypothetical protein
MRNSEVSTAANCAAVALESGITVMISVKRKSVLGWFGLAAATLAWASVFSTPWVPEGWKLRIFALAAVAVLLSLFLSIIAGRKGSRWWYLLAAISLVSAFVLLADLWAGV